MPLSFELAGRAERLTAMLIDLLILAGAALLLIVLVMIAGYAGMLPEPLAIVFLVGFLARCGYFVYFELHWRGMTPAKRMMRLRVISREGTGLSVNSVVARNVMRDLELFLPLAVVLAPEQVVGPSPWWLCLPALAWVFLLGTVPLLTANRTRAGDLVAGTLVVQEPNQPLLPDEAARGSDRQITFTLRQLSVYGEHELETLADILRRTSHGQAPYEGLKTIAQTIAAKIGYAGADPARQPHAFLQTFYTQQRAELENRLIYGKRIGSEHERHSRRNA